MQLENPIPRDETTFGLYLNVVDKLLNQNEKRSCDALNDSTNRRKGNKMSDTTTEAPKKKRLGVRTLSTADDVRRLLARLIKARLADDGIDNESLRAIVQACGILLKSIEAADLDTRLEEIETRLAEHEARK